ncbi:unnamed protein product, partial [Didymodactylos carnosus]
LIAQLRFHRRSGIIDVNKSPHPNGQMNVVYRNSPTRSGKSGSLRSRPPTTDLHSSDIKQDSDSERDNASRNIIRTTQDPAPFKASNHNPVSNVVKSGGDETVISPLDTDFHKTYRIIDVNRSPRLKGQMNIVYRNSPTRSGESSSSTGRSTTRDLHSRRHNPSSSMIDTVQDTTSFKGNNHSPLSKPIKNAAAVTSVSPLDTRFRRRSKALDANKSQSLLPQVDITDRHTAVRLKLCVSFIKASRVKDKEQASVEADNTSREVVDRDTDHASEKPDNISNEVIYRNEDHASEKVDSTSRDVIDRDEDQASANDGNTSREVIDRVEEQASANNGNTSRVAIDRDEDQASANDGSTSRVVTDRDEDQDSEKADDTSREMIAGDEEQ